MTDNLSLCIARFAADAPSAPAVAFADRTWTYRELEEEIRFVANRLEEQGIGPGDKVGLWLPNGDSWVVALFAVFRAGACAVLLHPSLHVRELADSIRGLGIAGLILNARQAASLDESVSVPRGRTLFPEGPYERDAVRTEGGSPARSPHDPTREEDEAVVLFTSGTTGRPKGVICTHRGLGINAVTTAGVLGIRPSDQGLIVMPLCHAYPLTRQLLSHLCVGACVRILPANALPDQLNYAIDRHGVTTFSGTPVHFAAMLRRGAGLAYPMAALRLATNGAIGMDAGLRQALSARFPHVAFYSTYGLSEAGSLVSVLPAHLFVRKGDSVGRAIPGVDVRLDPAEAGPVPGSGELLVRTPSRMKGYCSSGEAAEKPMGNASDDAAEGRDWLRTGDIATIDEEGDIAFVARKKELINRGGENVAPREVEAAVASLDGVEEVSVLGVPDERLGENVLAVVVKDAHRPELNEAAVIAWCRERLAPFKIPKAVLFVPAIEKTPSGKVIKKRLLERYEVEYVGPAR